MKTHIKVNIINPSNEYYYHIFCEKQHENNFNELLISFEIVDNKILFLNKKFIQKPSESSINELKQKFQDYEKHRQIKMFLKYVGIAIFISSSIYYICMYEMKKVMLEYEK